MADGATLSVFEQSGVKYLAQFFALDGKDLGDANEDGTVPVWKHIASVGEFKGHPSGGFEFTEKAFDEIIANFALRETPLNVDYEHQTFNRALKGRIDSAGWIVELKKSDDGKELWALLNLLPDAADAVRSKQLRQCSPVIVPEGTDRNTAKDIGFELRSLALTNDPFLDGLHPFQLTRVAAMTEDKKPEDAPAKDEPTTDDDKKVKELAEGDGGAAQSLIDRVASGAGSDMDTVLAVLEENLDMLVKAVQEAIEKGGTPAENSTNREMRAMTITIGKVEKPVNDKTLKLTVDAQEGKIKKLTEQVAEQAKTIKSFSDARAAAENAALEAKCKELQKQGFIRNDEQSLKDAIELFRSNPEMAERIYSMQIPPSGTEAGDDPQAESGKDASKPLLMSQLTDIQKAEYEGLRGYGKSEKEALEFIAKRAAQHQAAN